MSIRLTSFIEGEYYHIYNRGNSKQIIFHSSDDFQRFQDLLITLNKPERVDTRVVDRRKNSANVSSEGKTFATTRLVAIGSYCIMPNHFHILLTPLIEGGVSKFMQKITTAYSMYYNKKYKHTGGLFEGKFKAKHVTDDRYLKYLFAYINLNPVKIIDTLWKKRGLRDIEKTFIFLETYTFSSYFDLLHYNDNSKTRVESDILSLVAFPEYFPTGTLFKKEIISWFSYRENF